MQIFFLYVEINS